MSTVSIDPGTPSWSIDDLLGGHWSAQRKVVVEDAAGHRFVLLPEYQYNALQQRSLETFSDPTSARSTETAASDERRHHLPRRQQREAVRLTGREQQVLQLAATGHTGPATAEQLGLAPNTVAQHLAAVRRKYGVSSTAAAAAFAREGGLIS